MKIGEFRITVQNVEVVISVKKKHVVFRSPITVIT